MLLLSKVRNFGSGSGADREQIGSGSGADPLPKSCGSLSQSEAQNQRLTSHDLGRGSGADRERSGLGADQERIGRRSGGDPLLLSEPLIGSERSHEREDSGNATTSLIGLEAPHG